MTIYESNLNIFLLISYISHIFCLLPCSEMEAIGAAACAHSSKILNKKEEKTWLWPEEKMLQIFFLWMYLLILNKNCLISFLYTEKFFLKTNIFLIYIARLLVNSSVLEKKLVSSFSEHFKLKAIYKNTNTKYTIALSFIFRSKAFPVNTTVLLLINHSVVTYASVKFIF